MSDPVVRGTVHFIDQTKSYGQNGFRKRLVVLEQDSAKFTNYVPVEFIQDGCDSVDQMKLGDEVEITYRLSGRKWQKDPAAEVKYFLSAEARKFQVIGTAGSGGNAGKAVDANSSFAEAAIDENEVPF